MNGILVGYDGSEHSLRALEWAAHEAVIRREALTVLTIRETATAGWFEDKAAGADLADIRTLADEQAEKAVARAAAELPRPRVTVQAVEGLPAETLLSAASGAGMVVVGSRGTGGFARLRLGSVSSYIAHHAHCPVVVVPDDDI